MATLYRQYRPQVFADLVGQDPIRSTLQAALAQGTVGHAYLFAGPRGVGKTTVARLLAKAVNCPQPVVNADTTQLEPCNSCRLCTEIAEGRCLDVIEIDAASNRGIDEMRELRDKIAFAPSSAQFKVFIIDEVHMLTKEAFNALLKTLEEPPAHAKFILATTELHRVPVTITSRCQVFVFKKATSTDLASRLSAVAQAEGWTMEPEALALLARLAGGSYRDALSLLDQIRSIHGAAITRTAIADVLGIPSAERIQALLAAMAAGQRAEALALLSEAEAEGLDLDHVATQLIDAVRALLHVRYGLPADPLAAGAPAPSWQALAAAWSADDLAQLIRDLAGAKAMMKQASIALLPLELVVVKWSRDQRSANRSAGGDEAETPKKTAENDQSEPAKIEPQKHNQKPDEPAKDSQDSLPADEHFWPALLDRVRAVNMGLFGMLKQAEFVGIAGGELKLQVPFAFARDRLVERKHRETILALAEELAGAPLRLACEVCPRDHIVHHPEEEHDPAVVAAAVEVFEIEEAAG